MARREFSHNVKLEIIKRTMDAKGNLRCEKCFGVVKKGEVHHVDQDAMQIDKQTKLTASDGQFLCRECHQEITSAQAPVLAKAKRREKKALGIRIVPAKKIQSPPFPKSTKSANRIEKSRLPSRPLYQAIVK